MHYMGFKAIAIKARADIIPHHAQTSASGRPAARQGERGTRPLTSPLLRLGTRGSPLAIIQTNELRDALAAAHPELAAPGAIEVVPIQTTGDKVQDRALAEIGGKGLFTREIEERLIDRRIDMAVHSVKDVPTWMPDGFELVGMLPRADARDTLLGGQSLASLKPGTVVGTSSIRRQAQVLHARPDLKIVPFRGNVQTRMRKLAEGLANVTLLAQCGLDRLGVTNVGNVLQPDEMLPSVAQGVIGAEIRADDERARRYLEAVNHKPTSVVVGCERGLLDALDGSCRTPIAGYATLHGDRLRLQALVVSPDGRSVWRVEREGPASDGDALGHDAGEELRRIADPRIFDGP